MTEMELMRQRHSVRQYTDQAIDTETVLALQKEIDAVNQESGLSVQLITDEPKAFDSFLAHYGKFSGVSDYIAMVGKKSRQLDELCVYYGERLVLKVQELGLNSCWVALTYRKIPGTFKVEKNEKLVVVIAIGYGKTAGKAHISKSVQDISNLNTDSPEWFRKGVEAALLAPTAMNQQKFRLIYNNGKVKASAGMGFYTQLDLGIVRYHFELGAGKENFTWE